MRVARTRSGHDVVIRVIVIGNEGHKHLDILRRISGGEKSLFSNNHSLPMFAEFQIEDIIFGFFLKAGDSCQRAYNSWPKNSVGDVIDMLIQMSEASSLQLNCYIGYLLMQMSRPSHLSTT